MTFALVGIGLAAGFFSGLFGVGGGLIVVPGLVVIMRLDHRRAVGTSLLAILPAVLGSLGAYAVAGSVNFLVGGLLALGAVAGAQLGSWLLQRMPVRVAQWIFVGFVAVMIVQLIFLVPDRGAGIALDPLRIAGLIVLGLVAGVLSALLGIGAGGVVVAMLMLLGASDLTAKGASLVMMVPGVASGTVANLLRHNIDVRAAFVVGSASLVGSPLGAWAAHQVPPQVGSGLFAGFLAVIGIMMLRQALAARAPIGP